MYKFRNLNLRFVGEGETGGGAPAPVPSGPAQAANVPAAPDDDADAERLLAEAINSAEPEAPKYDQAYVDKLRKEAGDYRVAKKAADDRVQAILTAAGIKTDEPDPIEVAKQSTAAAEAARRELAIYKAAAIAGADPSRLLDSNSFMSSVTGLDPADGAAVSAAITAAMAANPLLKAVQATPASGGELGGTGEQGQITEAQLAQMTPEQINKAFKEGKLKHLL